MSVPNPCAAGNSDSSAEQNCAGAGAEIGDAQRTIEASTGAQQFQRQFDHRLGIRPRHQRRGRELQRQPPKFLLAENAGDGFACDAAAGEFVEASRFVRGELALRGRYQAGQVEAEGVARQNARVEFGGFDGGGFEFRGERASRGFDGLCGEDRSRGVLAQIPPHVVPANAGTHTPRPFDWGGVSRHLAATTNAGGYGSLRSQGRQRGGPHAAAPWAASCAA